MVEFHSTITVGVLPLFEGGGLARSTPSPAKRGGGVDLAEPPRAATIWHTARPNGIIDERKP